MPKPSFQIESLARTGDRTSAEMADTIPLAASPRLMVLESGIQALVKITGFTYIDDVPLAISGLSEKEVDAANLFVVRANRVDMKLEI